MRPPRIVPVLAAGLLAAGCGGSGGGGGDTAKVKQAISREFAALADGDGATACGLAIPAVQAKLASAVKGATCEQIIARLAAKLPAEVKTGMHNVAIKKVTINGSKASVADGDITATRGTLRGFLDPGSAPTNLARQPDGTWKFAL